MNEIDKIAKQLKDDGYRHFVPEVIDTIKRKYNIYQYTIAKDFGISPLEISNIKTHNRVKKNDELIWRIIKKYNVDYLFIIDKINENIARRKYEEEKNVKENQFERLAYLYDEIDDIIYTYTLNINTHTREATIQRKDYKEMHSGHITQRNINLYRNLGSKSYQSTSIQIMLNGKNINKNIKDKAVISGIATETENSDDGFGFKTLLIVPNDVKKDYESLIKFFFRNKDVQANFKSSSLKEFEKLIINYKKHNRAITIKLPKELITGYNQFLEYFSDYVKYSKGQEIKFDVTKVDDGLNIDLSVSDSLEIEKVGNYLEEYLNFAKENIDNLKVNIETDINKTDFNLLVLDLKHQVTSLKHSLEIAHMRNGMLDNQNNHLMELASNFSKKENVIHTQIINGGDQQFADKIKNTNEN